MAENDQKTDEKQKKLQQKYMELQMLDQQMKQIQAQVEAVERQAAELDEVQQNLDAIAASRQGSELFVPISNGIFLKAKLEDNTALAVNVGGNTVVKKDIPATKAMLAEQSKEMRKFQMDVVQQFEKLSERAVAIQSEMQKIIGE